MYRTALLALVGSARLAQATYSLADDYLDNGFFNNWDFFTGDDPTGGYVNYVDEDTAQSSGYVSTNSDGSIYLGVDYTNVASGRGRNSVRLTSLKTYTHYLTVIDLGHMPGGICGTWPAFWSFGSGGSGWPSEGEIDIIEGANDQQTNYMTLHTSPDCTIPTASDSMIQAVDDNCDANANGNEGCSFHSANPNSYGATFNSQGGGTYATEWTSQGVSIWFWPAGPGTPSDVLGPSPDPSGWGLPQATWGGSGCDWDTHLLDHNLVFDTTFCGSWAGNAFQSCSAANGGQTCNAFVQNNPAAFQDAYWQINALRVYQDNGTSAATSTSVTPSSTNTAAATSSASVSPTTTAAATSSVSSPTTSTAAATSSVSSPTTNTAAATSSVSSPSTTLATSPTGAASSIVSSPSSPTSSPSYPSSSSPSSESTSLPPTGSAGATTTSTAPGAAITSSSTTCSSTTTELESENSTGGVYEPVPTDDCDHDDEHHHKGRRHRHVRRDIKH